jgi:spore cortex formation protein SpoVR/YcgB (stage V sporulation)
LFIIWKKEKIKSYHSWLCKFFDYINNSDYTLLYSYKVHELQNLSLIVICIFFLSALCYNQNYVFRLFNSNTHILASLKQSAISTEKYISV